ncbi:MAG: SGNH/GDSL hydrolase family protein [Candidatus Sumerlaeota bacterium]|nr:SGNH/GDSL hydrolase family protein [Candidatus Sumerlaeota bacterium]
MRTMMALLSVFASSPFPASVLSAAETNGGSDDGLPKVLIIGDSISLGYKKPLEESLKGKALVKHNQGNAQHTGIGLERLDTWIGEEKWDVIHFNWGLWDLCYRNPDSDAPGHRDKVQGKLTNTLKEYEKNLDQLVTRLEKTGAVLIWASTTAVPEGEAGRFVGDDKKYNDVAEKVMKKHGVMIDDLYSLTKGLPPSLFLGPGNVHYTSEGYEKVAQRVAEVIEADLKGKPSAREDADSRPAQP